MSILLLLTLIWVGAVVLALVVYLSATAIYLHKTRRHLTAIAAGLERVVEQTAPLEKKIGAVGGAVGSIKGSLEQVDASLGAIIGVVERLTAADKGEPRVL